MSVQTEASKPGNNADLWVSLRDFLKHSVYDEEGSLTRKEFDAMYDQALAVLNATIEDESDTTLDKKKGKA